MLSGSECGDFTIRYNLGGNRVRSMKKNLAVVLSFAISGLIVGYLLFSLDWAVFLAEFYKIKSSFLIPWVLLWVGTNLFRALRWQILLGGRAVIRITQSFEAMMVGFFATFVLPLRAGEFVRAFYVAKISPLTFSKAFATIVVERVFDVLSLLLLLAVCLSRLDQAPEVVTLGAKALGLLCGVIVAVMVCAYLYPQALRRFVFRMVSFLSRGKDSSLIKKLMEMLDEFLDGLRCLDSWLGLLGVCCCSLGVWIGSVWFYQIAVSAMNIEADFWIGAIITLMVALAVAAPSAPGFVGTFQAGCVLALSVIYPYSKEFATAYSVFVHVLQAGLIIGCGGFYLLRRGIKLSQLKS